MIVAGSVLALLLMGLAIDGFVNPVDDEADDPSGDSGGEDAQLDESGGGDGLSDLLFPDENHDDSRIGGEPLSYIPLDAISPDAVSSDAIEIGAEPEPEVAEEGAADAEWHNAENVTPTNDFVEIDAVTGIETGGEVAYVEAFDTSTDALVLEFDGTSAEAPEITIDHEMEQDAAVVLANGLPVTLVEGAEDMAPDHVRVVMVGDGSLLGPQVLPDVEQSDDPLLEAEGDSTAPEEPTLEGHSTLPMPSEIENVIVDTGETLVDEHTRETAPSDPEILPPPPELVEELSTEIAPEVAPPTDPIDVTAPREAENTNPSTLLVSEQNESLLVETTEPLTGDQIEDLIDTGEIILGDVLETVVDPVVDVVDTISDGVPDLATVDAILDDVTENMTEVGGTDEMLNARAGMDDAFGTGGEDALTGTFNADMVRGGDGQDALFGDEGNDTLQAGAGNDELHGDFGNDSLMGEAGVDFLDGGEGNDTLDGGGDRDLLFGGEGDDVLYGGAADDFLQGGMGADMLSGGSGNDVLDGVFSRGSVDQDDGDTLWGGDGDDTLIIGQGDVAHGGAGADTFVSGSFVETAEFAGRVEDFNPGEDRIEVIFDPAESPDPTLEVQDFADGSGADIILNGEVILSVAGAQGLDPNLIELRAIA